MQSKVRFLAHGPLADYSCATAPDSVCVFCNAHITGFAVSPRAIRGHGDLNCGSIQLCDRE